MTTDKPIIPIKRYKMSLLSEEFLSDVSGNNGRFPKGAVLLVDEETAERWYERGIAEIAPPDALTHGEIQRHSKREAFRRLARPAEGAFDQMVSRSALTEARPTGSEVPRDSTAMPAPMPQPRRGRPPKDLGGINLLDTSDEE